MKIPHFSHILCFLLLSSCVHAEIRPGTKDAILSGVAWFDQNGNVVSAHGGGILKEGGRYYLFGEFKRDHGNAFNGFSCYSSADLMSWRFERIALPVQKDGRLGPNRVGERPKVLKCPKTGRFVMYMHTDDINYKDPAVGYAICDTIDGEYKFQGALQHNGKRIGKWDMSAFQDDDGTGYIVTHSGNLYQLSDDFQSVTAQVVKGMTHGCEAPAIFKRNGCYYWLGSGLTGWERNDNYYFTAKSLKGPWEKRGFFAPEGSLTWNSQTTFVLPISGSKETTYMFMGDRWAHPRQNSAATYVWQPLRFDTLGAISLPAFEQGWRPDTKTGSWSPAETTGEMTAIRDMKNVVKSGTWAPHTDDKGFSDLRSNEKGATLAISFTGTRIGLQGVARPDGGFGGVTIKDADGKLLLTTVMESYCLYEEKSLKFLSPALEPGNYTLTVTVLGERFFWQGKKAVYGSKGDFVSVSEVSVAR